ncbi:MAG: hypothetical protein ABIP30_16020 [Ferruginibacter sp.]
MYKLDKTVSKITTNEDAENDKKFSDDTSSSERLQQSWWLTCMAYGIDPENPPKMEKRLTYKGKHRP